MLWAFLHVNIIVNIIKKTLQPNPSKIIKISAQNKDTRIKS